MLSLGKLIPRASAMSSSFLDHGSPFYASGVMWPKPTPGYAAAITSWVKTMLSLLWTAVVVLFALWLLGLSLHIAGSLIHILLVLAIALAIYNFAMNRDARQP